MQEIFHNLLLSNFIPHGHCYLWNPRLVGLNIISDALIAISYYSIPLVLIYFVRKRRDIPFSGIFVLFGAFIVACGTTHLMEIWTLWHPNYWLSGLLKAITAAISCYTALQLIPLIPQALSLPSPSELETGNRELQKQIQERIGAEKELQKVNEELELRVQERTFALKQLNEQMVLKILERHQTQEALQESTQQITHILESIAEAFFALDFKWNFTYVNKEAERILQTKREELIGKNVWSEFPEAVGSIFEQEYRRAATEKIVVTFESFYPPLETWFEVRAYPANGGISVFFRDITQQKHDLEAIARSEELYRTLARNFPNGAVLLYDSELRFTLAEGSDLKAVGLSKALMEGKTVYEVFPPEICEFLAPLFCAALAGEATVFEQSYGDRIYQGHSIPVRNEKGEVFAGLCMTQNITDRKRWIRELQETTSLQRAILDGANYTIISTAPDGTICTFNAAAERFLGYAAAEVVGKTTLARLHDFEEVAAYATELSEELGVNIEPGFEVFVAKARRGEPDEREWSYIRKDGSRFPVLLSVTALRDAENKIAGFLGIGNDISERKQAESALRRSEQRFQRLAENVPGMIYQFRLGKDGDMSFPYVSSGCREIYELEPEEILKDAAIAINTTHPDDLSRFSESIAVSASTMQPWHWEGRIVLESGSLKWIQGASRPELQENGDVLWDGLLIDVSDRKLAESALRQSEAEKTQLIASLQAQAAQLEEAMSELQQTQTQLIQTEKMSSLGQLVAGVAHEINNPVSFIYSNIAPAKQYFNDLVGLLQLYRQHYPKPASEIEAEIEAIDLDFLTLDLQKLLGSLKVGAERIREIVNSLRNFSRLDEADRKQVDIEIGIENTLLILQHRLRGTGGDREIKIVKEYGHLPLVECYAGQLNQVFMNVLVNAIDALESEISQSPIPTIWIRTAVVGENAVITITDNGPGMADNVRTRLFDPFFTTKEVGKGTGLGLSISYSVVVEKHGGKLVCFSQPGEGTEFAIEIPINPGDRNNSFCSLSTANNSVKNRRHLNQINAEQCS